MSIIARQHQYLLSLSIQALFILQLTYISDKKIDIFLMSVHVLIPRITSSHFFKIDNVFTAF